MLKMIIADDHSIIRKGLRLILGEQYPTALIEEAGNGDEVVKKLSAHTWDIVICDLSMPQRTGLEVLRFVKDHYPKLPVLILSIHPEEQYALRILKAGAAGYLCKDSASNELNIAVQKILEGKKYVSPTLAELMISDIEKPVAEHAHSLLTDREFLVFKYIAEGKKVTEVAEMLSISVTTVSTHRARLLNKMHLHSNADIVRYALENKLI